MTNDRVLWAALRSHLPRHQWVPIGEIYTIVQHRVVLDAEDLDCRTARSYTPRWKYNLRRLLRSKQREGKLLRRVAP